MEIDPGVLAFYQALKAQTPAGSENWPLERQRLAWNDLCKQFRALRPQGLIVSDLETDGVKFRLYVPQGKALKPGVIYAMVAAGFWAGLKPMMIYAPKWPRVLIVLWL